MTGEWQFPLGIGFLHTRQWSGWLFVDQQAWQQIAVRRYLEKVNSRDTSGVEEDNTFARSCLHSCRQSVSRHTV